MDQKLFSDIIKEVLVRDGNACLPGLGTFVTEEAPAQFSEKGFTINPPYLKIEFRTDMPQDQGLVDFYCKANRESSNVAREVIIDYIASLGKQLYQLKNLDFPGLGRLRAARGGAVIFVPDEDLSIFPQYDCLEPVSLRFRPEPVMGFAFEEVPAEDVPVEETPADEVLTDDVAVEETPTTVEMEETGAPAEEAESIAPAEEAVAGQEISAPAEAVAEESAETEAVVPAEPAAEESAEEGAEASAAEETAEAIEEAPSAAEESAEESAEPAAEESAETIEEAPSAVEESAEAIEEAPSAEEESVEESAEPAVEDTAESPSTTEETAEETPSNPARTFWIGVLVLVILAALFFAAVAIIGRTYPELIDPYLYTPSELKILRAKL